MKRRNRVGVERLENRYCLTVAVTVDNGDLVVSGDADGAVEITAVDATTYQVKDNGVVVATEQNVNDDIRIGIDATAGANNQVTIDLAGQAVNKIMADLGNGDNSLLVKGGTVHGNLTFTGGTGNDQLQLAAGTTVEKSVIAKMGEGDNSVSVDGSITRDLYV